MAALYPGGTTSEPFLGTPVGIARAARMLGTVRSSPNRQASPTPPASPVLPAVPLVVGFDLDMTLVDSAPGFRTTFEAVAVETDVAIDVDLVMTRLGPKLEFEMAEWYPAEEVGPVCDLFRERYRTLGVPGTFLMPGAAEALAAVRAVGGRSLVVTAKYEPNARACLDHVGLQVDHVVGWRFGTAKGETLREHGARIYVGDTTHDVEGARAAGAVAVGVATGYHDAAELRTAGADELLGSLAQFPAWLVTWLGGAPVRP